MTIFFAYGFRKNPSSGEDILNGSLQPLRPVVSLSVIVLMSLALWSAIWLVGAAIASSLQL
jgi:hypothetical protein